MLNRGTQSTVATDPALLEIAKSIGITPSQLALSWAVQRGTSVIPKSAQEKRIRANLERECIPLVVSRLSNAGPISVQFANLKIPLSCVTFG